MRISLRPKEVVVTEAEPFAFDRLDRKEAVLVLRDLVTRLEGPCVVCVRAPWGTGKSTFLRMLAASLRNHECRVAEYNAWETDFADQPFAALSSELLGALGEASPTAKVTAALARTRSAAKAVLKRAIPQLIKLGTGGAIDLTAALEAAVAETAKEVAEDALTAYEAGRDSISDFKEELATLASRVAESSTDQPLVIIVDELDRCRPTYAVEFLEVAKHLFSVPGIVFVIAIDRRELAHAVRALYGAGFDAEGYLRRFFDLDYRLPEPPVEAYVEAVWQDIDVAGIPGRTKDGEAETDLHLAKELFKTVFARRDMSLREAAQVLHRFGTVLASVPPKKRVLALPTAVLLVVRSWDDALYRRLLRGKVSDRELVKTIIESTALSDVREEHVIHVFEAFLLVAAGEFGCSVPESERIKEIAESTNELADSMEERDRAVRLHQLVSSFVRRNFRYSLGFRFAATRVELLSPGLGISEPSDEGPANSA